MSGMIEVAQATVSIIPNMQGAQQTISSELSDICGSAGLKASGIAGPKFLKGFAGKLGGLKSVMSKAIPVAAVGAVGKALFEVGKEFDSMHDVIVTKTGASGAALESLQEHAEHLFASLPADAETIGDAIGEVNTRFGLTGDALEELSGQYVQFAKLNNLDISSSIDDTQKAMAALGVPTEQAAVFLDTLNAVGQQTGIDMGTLSSELVANAAVLQDLGMNASDAAMFVANLDKSGVDGSTALTAFSKAMMNAAKEGKTTGEALGELQSVMESDASSTEKLSALSELFGTKAAPKMMAALENGDITFEALGTSMDDFAGSVSNTAEETYSFGERVDILKNQFKTLLEPMGSAVFSGLSSAMAVITEQFGKFVDGPGKAIGEAFGVIVEEGKKAIEMIGQAFSKTTGISSFGDAMKKVKGTAKELFSAMKPVLNVLTTLLKAIIPPLAKFVGTYLGTAFKVLSAVVKNVINTFKTFGKIIDGAKRAFEAFKRIVTAPFRFLSNIKIPRINISGGKAPWGLGGLGERPSISIKWAAKGLILDKATLIGAGEAGKEGIVPLSGEAMRPFAQAIAEELPGGGTENMTINLNYDASDDAADMLHDIVRGVKRYRMAGVI